MKICEIVGNSASIGEDVMEKSDEVKFMYGEHDGLERPDLEKLVVDGVEIAPVRFKLSRPADSSGKERDQTTDAARNMRYAASLQLPEIMRSPWLRQGRAVICGGGPSLKNHLDTVKKLSEDPDNAIFTLNFSHNWLIDQGIIPFGCVLFEVDAEPDEFLGAANQKVAYFICSHCDAKTFDQLKGAKRILWHSPPASPVEEAVAKESFPNAFYIAGGVGTFLRTISIAMCLGYRNIDLFGCDSSFPDDASSTHVEGYKTANDVDKDSFYVWVRPSNKYDAVRKFKTVGYLSLQVEEFKIYCQQNHHLFALRVHGDNLLRYVHETEWPYQYTPVQAIPCKMR